MDTKELFNKLKIGGVRVLGFGAGMLYPDDIKCIACDGELRQDTRYGLCHECELPIVGHRCELCGRHIVDMANICEDCKGTTNNFGYARAAFLYKDSVVGIVRKLKFGSRKDLAIKMAQFMIDAYYLDNMKVDFITAVPLHSSKLRVRGYNQAQEIAMVIASSVDKPLINALFRLVQNKDTARLGKQERMAAVKGAFSLDESVRDIVKGKTILLIDDVFTTGATVNECCAVLKNAGVKKVVVLTFATGVSRQLRLD